MLCKKRAGNLNIVRVRIDQPRATIIVPAVDQSQAATSDLAMDQSQTTIIFPAMDQSQAATSDLAMDQSQTAIIVPAMGQSQAATRDLAMDLARTVAVNIRKERLVINIINTYRKYDHLHYTVV